MTCKYCKNETCINGECPDYRNYCPYQDYYNVKLCRFAEKRAEKLTDKLIEGDSK